MTSFGLRRAKEAFLSVFRPAIAPAGNMQFLEMDVLLSNAHFGNGGGEAG